MRIYLWLCFLGMFNLAHSQHKPLLYNVGDLPQGLMLNPGMQLDLTGHIGLPLFSQVHLSAGASGVSVYDIFGDDATNINTRIREAMHNMDSYDHFMVNEQLEIMNLGWQIDRRNYLSVGIYQELDLFFYFPRDLAILVNEGNNDYINDTFDFSQAALTGEIMTVYHLGLNHIFDNQLTVGIRGKLYSGIFNAESTGNTGQFTTYDNPNGRNYYRHVVENMDVRVNTSGFEPLEDADMSVEEGTAELLRRSFFGGNVGVGADFGLSYRINQHLVTTASVLDLGVMFQRNEVENYLYYGSYESEGIEPLFPEINENGSTLPYWQRFEDEVDANLVDETLNEAYITWRPTKFNLGVEYGFGEVFLPCNYLTVTEVRYMNQFGMNLSGVKRPRNIVYSFTSYWDRKISDKQRFRVAHTLNDYSMLNLGLMYSTTFKKFNFYIAANNLLAFPDLAKAHGASIQLGMQFLFKR